MRTQALGSHGVYQNICVLATLSISKSSDEKFSDFTELLRSKQESWADSICSLNFCARRNRSESRAGKSK